MLAQEFDVETAVGTAVVELFTFFFSYDYSIDVERLRAPLRSPGLVGKELIYTCSLLRNNTPCGKE